MTFQLLILSTIYPQSIPCLGITAHWLDDKYLLKSVALGLVRLLGSHTNVELASAISNLHKCFKIQNKVDRGITDNGANFVFAYQYVLTIPNIEENRKSHPLFFASYRFRSTLT